MDHHTVKNFYGQPVIVQLRFPIAAVEVKEKGMLPYADLNDKAYWIPNSKMENGSPFATQLVAFAVLHQLEEAGTVLEMVWSSVPAEPRPGQIMGTVATIATLIDTRDIVAITRVVAVSEPDSSLILKP